MSQFFLYENQLDCKLLYFLRVHCNFCYRDTSLIAYIYLSKFFRIFFFSFASPRRNSVLEKLERTTMLLAQLLKSLPLSVPLNFILIAFERNNLRPPERKVYQVLSCSLSNSSNQSFHENYFSFPFVLGCLRQDSLTYWIVVFQQQA